ncbi:MAG: hypothetical protein ACR2JC_06925 [Chloroflexota bacterium]
MAQTQQGRNQVNSDDGRSEDLRQSPMMAHLLDALQSGTDIGHYGRLVFVMIARHFKGDDDIIELLAKQPEHGEEDSRALLAQVKVRDYNPPKRDKILAWQAEQDFPIIPNSEDPDSGNVYRDLHFPDHIYENIGDYYEDKVEASEASRH